MKKKDNGTFSSLQALKMSFSIVYTSAFSLFEAASPPKRQLKKRL